MALYDSSEEAPPWLWAYGWEAEETGYSTNRGARPTWGGHGAVEFPSDTE